MNRPSFISVASDEKAPEPDRHNPPAPKVQPLPAPPIRRNPPSPNQVPLPTPTKKKK